MATREKKGQGYVKGNGLFLGTLELIEGYLYG